MIHRLGAVRSPALAVPLPPTLELGACYRYCEALCRARHHNYPVASMFARSELRKHIFALFAFARVADDFADEVSFEGRRARELDRWEEQLHEHAIRPMQQYDYSKGKNASDMAMVIDAMALLYTDRPDAFGIVSSDADFTPLVMHLREKGAAVYGFGRKCRTPSSAALTVCSLVATPLAAMMGSCGFIFRKIWMVAGPSRSGIIISAITAATSASRLA